MIQDMHILVCFRVVPDLDMMPADGWEVDDRSRVDMSYVRSMLNPYDESALEFALRLRDGLAGTSRTAHVALTALTVGGERSNAFLKTMAALGFERVVRVDPGEDEPAAETVASALAAFAAENGADVVLTGSRSGMADSGKTPFFLAELLGWRCRAQVMDLQVGAGGIVRVVRRVDAGMATSALAAPCVLAVGDAPGVGLRIPTLRDRMTRGKLEIDVVPMPTSAPEGAVPPELVSLARVDNSRAGTIIDGATAEEKAGILYREYLRPRMEKPGQ